MKQQVEINDKLKDFLAQQLDTIDSLKKIKLFITKLDDPVVQLNTKTERLITEFLQKTNANVQIKKISPNNYLFGDKLIITKIIEGVLCVKVGRSSISLEKFYYEHYLKKDQEYNIKIPLPTQT